MNHTNKVKIISILLAAVAGLLLVAGNAIPAHAAPVWTSATAPWLPSSALTSIVFNSKMWVITGHYVWSSPDGITWTNALVPWPSPSALTSVVFNSKIWVITNQNSVWSSPDGVTWTQAFSPLGGTSALTSVVFNSKMWVITTNSGRIWSSPFFVTNTLAAIAPWPSQTIAPPSVVFNGKMWAMTALSRVWSSPDGVTWTMAATAPWPPGVVEASVVFNNKIWVITNWSNVWSSPDGVTWTQETVSPWAPNMVLASVVFNNEIWVMTDGSRIWSGSEPAVAPTITTQPANQTVTAGQTATFTVVAAGTAPLGYQWQENGVAIPGATSPSYTTPATTASDNGAQFIVVVTNTAGSISSSVAILTVNPAAVCGNGILEGTEQCDLGVAANGPCPSLCSSSCTTNSCAPPAISLAPASLSASASCNVSVGAVQVDSISTAVWQQPPTNVATPLAVSTWIPNIPPYPDKGGEVDGPAGTVMCGLYSSGGANGGSGPTMANVPIYCPLTSLLASAGASIGGSSYQIDSSADGGSMSCNAGDVVVGAQWAKNNQLDFGYCKHLTVGGAPANLVVNYVPIPAVANGNAYCPSGSFMVGGQNSVGKNDSWGAFYCAQIQVSPTLPTPLGYLPLAAFTPVSASWYFIPGASVSDPCGAGGLLDCSRTGHLYQGLPTGLYALAAPFVDPITGLQQPFPAGFSLNGIRQAVRDVAQAPSPSSLFAELWDKIVNTARAFSILPGGGTVSSQTAIAGNTINFVIEWDPTSTPPLPPPPPPTCSPNTPVVTVGTAISFIGAQGDGTYVWSAPGGAPSGPIGGNPFRTSYNATGTKTVTVTSAGQSGTCTVDVQNTVSCTRTDSGGNPIFATAVNRGDTAYFRASGGTGSYSWNTPGGNAPLPRSGQNFSVFYNATGTKTVTVTSGIGTDQCMVNVENVYCDYFRATPTKIIVPDQSTLSWQCHNASYGCAISSSVGVSPGPVDPGEASGASIPVTPRETTLYTLTCKGTPDAVKTAQVTVQVVSSYICEANPFAPGCPKANP